MMLKFRPVALALALIFALCSSADASCYLWSKTANSNTNADLTINWATGISPSTVSPNGRAMMAAVAKCRDDWSGVLSTTGTSTAYVLTTNQAFDTLAHMDGAKVCFRPNVTNGTPATLNVDGLGAKSLNRSPSSALTAALLLAGAPYCATYVNSASEWLLQDYYPAAVTGGTVTSVATGTGLTGGPITGTGTVSFATVANGSVLANISGSTAVPSANTLTAILDAAISSTQGVILYRGASTWAALATGTSGQLLQTQGAAANPQWASITGAATTLVDSGSLPAAATKEVTIPSGYTNIVIYFNGVSGNTSTREFIIRVSTDGGVSYDATAASYTGVFAAGGTFGPKALASVIESAALASSAAWSGTVKIENYASAVHKLFNYSMTANSEYLGSGRYSGSTTAIDHIQFLWTPGSSFDAGTYAVYVVR